MEKPKLKPMTKTELEMAKNIIIMLDARAKKTKKNDAWFLPKEFVEFCKGIDITNHKSRSFIKVLHLSGHLNRVAVNKLANKYTLNPDSIEMMSIIGSLITPAIKKVSKNMPIGTKLTEKEAAVGLEIRKYVEFAKTLRSTSPSALFKDGSFQAKNVVNHLVRHSICKHNNARYYIRYLHGRGFLKRVKRGVYKIADVKSIKKPQKVKNSDCQGGWQGGWEATPEIKAVQKKCVKVTYGEKQMLNKMDEMQNQMTDMSQTISGLHMVVSELTLGAKKKELTLHNLFKRKLTPKTQLVKGG